MIARVLEGEIDAAIYRAAPGRETYRVALADAR
jgi:hypothetical protein